MGGLDRIRGADRIRGTRGFTLIETVVVLAIGTIVAGGIGGVLIQSVVLPDQGVSRLVIEQEMRNLTTWVRVDANKAQSFQPGASATDYGTFYWLDFSTYPPIRRSSNYFWDEQTVYRQPMVEGVVEAPIPLSRHIASPTDVVFTLIESPHPLANTSTERFLRVDVTSTTEPTASDPVQESDSVEVELRPEQTNPAEHRFFFLHNNPTPPVGDTASRSDLPMDATAPTAATLFNYDTDNDSFAGRKIRRSRRGGELETSTPDKFQDWLSPAFAVDTTIDGRASLFLSGAASGFTTDRIVIVSSWLLDFDPVALTSELIVSRSVGGFTSEAGWREVSVHFRPVIYTLPAGHRLRLKIQVDGQSTVDGMVAYDTANHISLLMVPVQP